VRNFELLGGIVSSQRGGGSLCSAKEKREARRLKGAGKRVAEARLGKRKHFIHGNAHVSVEKKKKGKEPNGKEKRVCSLAGKVAT